MNNVLVVENLVKIFANNFVAVDNISFALKEGEILGFLGPNGAGKTTSIQMLLGILKPTSGSITYLGKNFFTHRSEILQSVSFASSYLRLPPTLTVYENLDIYGRLYGLDKKMREANIDKYLKLFGMISYKNKKVLGLSAGQMTRVMLSKAFIVEPKIILLDEPTASLDPDVCAEIREFILAIKKSIKTSMLFTSHNMAEVEEVCDRVLVIKQGKIIADEKPENLAKSVAHTKIKLMGVNNDLLINLFKEQLKITLLPHETEIEIEEEKIAWFFNSLSKAGIDYSQVSIDKPKLEDYFLKIAKGS